jgi:RNA polymerase sigma-70 factor (ECF subfamily)
MSHSQSASASGIRGCNDELGKAFWQLWQQYRDYLHRCCIKWMGGNPTDAEDALSRAMLKAWEKVQKYAGEITNFKAWLTRLTRNLCVDIYRERSRGANRVEDIEGYASGEEQGLIPSEDTPESAVETGEKRIVIRRAIDNLPTRLRETFILHFYEELSYPEIVQRQEISYQNVCKRISQARKILRLELRGYFIEEEGTDTDKSVPSTATESAIGEMSQGNAPVEPIVGETVTLSEAVEEVESVEGEEAIEVVRDVQHSESVMVAATNDGKLEVKSDGCRCVEAALCERLLAPILALAQFVEEAGRWGNSCLNAKNSEIDYWNRCKGVERNKIDKKIMKLALVKTTASTTRVSATYQGQTIGPKPSSVSPNWEIPVWPSYISISQYNDSQELLHTWTMSVGKNQKDVHFWKGDYTQSSPSDANKIDKHTDYVVTINSKGDVTFSEAVE